MTGPPKAAAFVDGVACADPGDIIAKPATSANAKSAMRVNDFMYSPYEV
jgi:hypothetical protein